MLPGDDGFAILSRLKKDRATAHIPVIMVSAKGEEVSKVKGLNTGADDYIAKPFSVLELIARIKANLRKSGKDTGGTIAYKNIVIDLSQHCVTVNDKIVQMTLKEYNLLSLLCKNYQKVQMRDVIFSKVWDDNFIGESRTLDMHIRELRKKLAEAGSEAVIKTVRGVGYMLL
jgi:two-component system alkaline phosphatase synthesis response regulator PhoP